MTRRQFLGAMTLPVAVLAGRRRPGLLAQQEDADARQRVTLLVQEFDRQGNHRTGTRPDTVSAQWLSTAMQRWRVDAALQPVLVEGVEPVAAHVQFRERRIEGVPLYDATFTDPAGVVGRIAPAGAGTEIALVESDDERWPAIRRDGGHAGIVLVTKGPRSGLVVQDAPSFDAPFGPPVLQVSSEEAPWLREQAGQRPDVRLVTHVRRAALRALVVAGRVRGRDPGLPPLVISAPRSTWWRGTSERGGGLATFLEIVRAVATARPVRDCMFLSAAGQELGHLGLAAFLEKNPSLAKEAHAWLVLGPSLGAAQGTRAFTATSEDLGATAREMLAPSGFELQPALDDGSEAARVAAAGARVVSVRGVGNPLVGMAADRWPEAVEANALVTAADACARLALALTHVQARSHGGRS